MQKTILTSIVCLFTVAASAQYFPKETVARTNDLTISGPTLDAIGGPGPHLLKYNQPRTASGSAVREGLIPDIKPLLNVQIRDAVINIGHDGRYYLTGSTGDDIWTENKGVELWVSDNLKDWEYLGLVWTFDKDGTWQKEWRFHHHPVRALWAPELHYMKGTYWITLSMPPGDRGLLKSTTGLPTGPYVNALANDGKWDGGIDGTLFQDDDGTVYILTDGNLIARMKDDMSGMAEEPHKLYVENPDTIPSHHAKSCPKRCGANDVGHEGIFMFKRNGLYYWTAADTYEGRYSSMVAVSENIYGPYRNRHEAVPCSGGTCYFKDKEGRWWCTYFGNDSQAPFREMPAMIEVTFDDKGMISVKR